MANLTNAADVTTFVALTLSRDRKKSR